MRATRLVTARHAVYLAPSTRKMNTKSQLLAVHQIGFTTSAEFWPTTASATAEHGKTLICIHILQCFHRL
ncbi:hypothetical protein BDV96DRAFT_578441 [Lophiotrema nucula]|uniref:Uncharacterized protein n=1 Tax=Lophiotrema nucula TaxID=690887 RepID=A0A6A5Z373_9PLEO|nr:hypothetical protein BDV96DRAFT_578441 [Lophiotrema nucula]